MKDLQINRRQFTAGAAATVAATAIGSRRADAQAYGTQELIEAAKKEGKFVYYTADFMRREFPHSTVLPPTDGDMQHCCVIRRDA